MVETNRDTDITILAALLGINVIGLFHVLSIENPSILEWIYLILVTFTLPVLCTAFVALKEKKIEEIPKSLGIKLFVLYGCIFTIAGLGLLIADKSILASAVYIFLTIFGIFVLFMLPKK